MEITEKVEHFLKKTEQKYGGLVRIEAKPSPLHPINYDKEKTMYQGGDRMGGQVKAFSYAKNFAPLIDKELVIVEVGILTGIGLAIWTELFPKARVIGLDHDISVYQNNKENLKNLGLKREPEVYKFDQFIDNTELLKEILKGDKVDIVIDDGCHIPKAILKTIDSFRPHLKKDFLYFVEDHISVHNEIKKRYPYKVEFEFDFTTIYGNR